MLDETARQREGLAAEAQAEWNGRYRESFDPELMNVLQTARRLADQLRTKAQNIDYASENVREEQRQRERERERWWWEKREEERAAAAAAQTPAPSPPTTFW